MYSLIDLAPDELTCEWFRRLADWVTPGGRMIIGSYGIRSRGIGPIDVASALDGCSSVVIGSAAGGDPIMSNFAWTALIDV